MFGDDHLSTLILLNVLGIAGIAAWALFEAEHAKTVLEQFKLLSVFAGHKQLLRSIDLQALATARRDLTCFNASRHLPWPVLNDDTLQPVAPVEWIRLDTADREAMTWKEWRDRFHARYLELEVGRNLEGLRAKKCDPIL